MPFKNRVVVVTGAAGALGPTACRALAEAGAQLALAGRQLEPLKELVASLPLSADQALTHTADLGDPAQVQGFAEAVKNKFGRAEAVLHMVGGYQAGATIQDLDVAAMQAMLDQHLWTTLHIARAFTPLLVANGWGRVAVISTPLAQTPGAKQAPYAVGKAAQDILMMVLAQELKGTGVTANCLQVKSIETQAPGPTVMVGHGRAGAVEAPPPDLTKPRTGTTPAELTAALLWLCSDEAGAVNGARIPVFGRG